MPEKDEKCLTPPTLKKIPPGWLAVGAAVVGAVVAGLAVGMGRKRTGRQSAEPDRMVEVDSWNPDDFLDTLYFGKLESALRRVRSKWEPHVEAYRIFDSMWDDAQRIGELERQGAPSPDFTIDWTRRGPYVPPPDTMPRHRFALPPRNVAERDEVERPR